MPRYQCVCILQRADSFNAALVDKKHRVSISSEPHVSRPQSPEKAEVRVRSQSYRQACGGAGFGWVFVVVEHDATKTPRRNPRVKNKRQKKAGAVVVLPPPPSSPLPPPPSSPALRPSRWRPSRPSKRTPLRTPSTRPGRRWAPQEAPRKNVFRRPPRATPLRTMP